MTSGEGIRSFIHKHSLSNSYKIVPEGDRKVGTSIPDEIHTCPNCGSNKTNEVSKTTRFCLSCDIEFDKNNNIYTIMYNGDLVDYHINEFMNCG